MAVRRLAGLHLGGRPLSRVARALASASHYRALIVALTVYVNPLDSLRRYLFGGGRYPYSCRLRTPAGALNLTLHHPHDIRTVNEIFCRGDYATPMTPQFVVDVGANIGVSGAYFLTRENGVRCHFVEPNPRNVALLHKNLDPFSGRWTIDECAVSDFDGYADFGTEES